MAEHVFVGDIGPIYQERIDGRRGPRYRVDTDYDLEIDWKRLLVYELILMGLAGLAITLVPRRPSVRTPRMPSQWIAGARHDGKAHPAAGVEDALRQTPTLQGRSAAERHAEPAGGDAEPSQHPPDRKP